MSDLMRKLQQTKDAKLLLLPRVMAGGPLLVFSIMHFKDPGHFHDILIASGFPLAELSVPVASAAELLAGLLLLSGFLPRIGGLLGVATMLPAIYATVALMGMTTADLPSGLTEVPFVPPVPLPVMIVVTSIIVVVLGGGRLSLDWKMSHNSESE